MHIAGADGRQFHGLMIDPRIVKHHGLVSFDLPWHGKSPPPEGAIQGSWRLDLYDALIMGFIDAAGLEKPRRPTPGPSQRHLPGTIILRAQF